MYSLDIETLIGVLQNRSIQGSLEADLATGGVSGPLRQASVHIELKEGRIISATIQDAYGRVLYQEKEALKRIRGIVFQWQLIETGAPPSPASSEREHFTEPFFARERTTDPSMRKAPDTGPFSGRLEPSATSFPVNTQPLGTFNSSLAGIGELVPTRYRQFAPEYLRTMSRSVRSVYGLVNGLNSIQRIADLLSLPVNTVYTELMALRREQLILFLGDSH